MESFDETENGKGEELAGSIKVCIHTSHPPPPPSQIYVYNNC